MVPSLRLAVSQTIGVVSTLASSKEEIRLRSIQDSSTIHRGELACAEGNKRTTIRAIHRRSWNHEHASKVAVIGAITLVAAALVTGFLTRPIPERPGPPAPPGQPDPVSVTIYDRLGDTQYSESLNIKIDGKSEGDLVIQDRQRPEASMTESLAPGTHTFEIEGSTYALAQDGTYKQYPVVGEGTIDVIKGDSDQSFEVTGTITPSGIVADLGRV